MMSLMEILSSDNIVESINSNMDYLLSIIPDLKYLIGFDQKHPHHHLDAWNHTLLALSLSPNDFDIRLSLLLHDIGKPFSYQDEEVRHFRNHPKVSSDMAKKILNELGFEDSYIEYICYLILHHDTPITDKDILDDYDLCLKLFEIQKCDALAHHPNKQEKRKKYLEEIQNKLKINEKIKL